MIIEQRREPVREPAGEEHPERRAGHDDYALEIANVPQEPGPARRPKPARKVGKGRRGDPMLFDVDDTDSEGGH